MVMTSSFALTSQQQYERRLAQIQRELDRLSDATVRDVFALLSEVRREIVTALALVPVSDGSWPAHRLQMLLGALDGATREMQARMARTLAHGAKSAWDLGAEAQFRALGVTTGPVTAIDLDSLLFAQQMQADLVRNVTVAFRQRAAREVTLVVAGVRSPYEATQNVAELLRTQPKRGAPGMGLIAGQAERITRTEVLTAYNAADAARWDDLTVLVPELRKRWLATRDSRTRPDHIEAERRYAPGGRTGPIPLDVDFMVGGERARHAHDPRLSAAQRVNCRCTTAMWSPEWAE